jgi:FKBP-type peptidyl-prolyl cis-trans isomerase FkpA
MRILSLIILAGVLLSGCKQEKTLPSGYKYVKHTKASGAGVKLGDFAFCRIQLRNNDSVVISQEQIIPIPDSATFKQPLPQKHLYEAILLMKEKDSVTVFVPLDTVPEEQKMDGFKGAKLMYFDITLKQVITAKQVKDFQATLEQKTKKRDDTQTKSEFARAKAIVDKVAKDYKAGTLKDIKTTPSGLKYLVYEPGSGPNFKRDNFVFVDYYGALTNGTVFDNSFDRPTDYSLILGRDPVIAGWVEGLALMKKGMKAVFFIPSELGYGQAGNPPAIPGNSELIFYMEANDTFAPPAFLFLGQQQQGAQ